MATGGTMGFQFAFNMGFCMAFVSSFLVLFAIKVSYLEMTIAIDLSDCVDL